MPDYRKLAYHLARHPERRVTLSFEQVEAIIGGPLPAHAHVMTDWWATGGVARRERHTAPWRVLGWRFEQLDSYRGAVTFVRDVAEPRC